MAYSNINIIHWLLLIGAIFLLASCGLIITRTIQYYRKRADIRGYRFLFVVTLLFVFFQILGTVIILVNTYTPIPLTTSGLIFLEGVTTVIFAYILNRSYPDFLKIPSRQQMEETRIEHLKELQEKDILTQHAIRLYEMRDEISLEGRIITHQGQMIDANECAVKTFGYDSEAELLQKKVADLIWPDDLPMVQENMATNHTEAYLCRGMDKNGNMLKLKVRGKNTHDLQQREIRITVIHDLTHEKKLYNKLQEKLDLLMVNGEIQEIKTDIINKLSSK